MIRYLICSFFLFVLVQSMPAEAQSTSQVAFNQAANYFIDGQNQQALQTVNSALQKHPNDPKLQALKKKLEEQQKQQQQNQQNQQQEGENQEDQEGDPKDSEGKGQEQQEKEPKEGNSEEEKEGDGEEKKEEESENGEQKEEKPGQEGEENENEGNPGSIDTEKRLEEMNISPEKARMILEAMKSNEVQYLQQKKRRQNKRSDNGRPDW